MSTRVSILIPAYNEAPGIGDTLRRCVGVPQTETIVVDGGSNDETGKLAAEFGANVFVSPRGRSLQMNLAATKARGEILLFLHADTYLPEGFREHVVSLLQRPEVIAGAFQLRIRGSARSLRLIELGVRIRSHFLKLPYGDQAIFLRAETFRRINGFREIPIMEDLDLVRRLGRTGKIAVVNAHVQTSARRWNEVGILKTTLINQLAVAAYLAGMSPDRIACFYYRDRDKTSQNRD